MHSQFAFHAIDFGGQLLHVAIRPGNPRLTPLLFFNGIGASLEIIWPFVQSLDPGQTVIAFDAPGVGGSPTPRLPFRFSGLAKLAAQLLDHFEVERVNVLGVSWGGFLAQQFARDYPERCDRLVLAATSSGVIGVPGSLSLGLEMASPRRYTDASHAEKVAPKLYGGDYRRDPAWAKSHAERVKPACPRGYAYQLAALAGWTSLHWLHRVRHPALVMAGDDDPLIPLVNARMLAWCLPNAELRVIEDGGHLFLLTQAAAAADTITEFLGRQDAAAMPHANDNHKISQEAV